jgi:hypothetical protein
MSSNDRKRLETVLAYHTAPTFMGFKCGSLLTLSVKDYDLDELARLFEEGCFGRRIRARFISRSKERTLIYVYDIKTGEVAKGIDVAEGYYFEQIRIVED